MDNERYLLLVTRDVSGEITPEEKTELEDFLMNSPEEQERYRVLDKFWRQEVYAEPSTDVDVALQKVLTRINSGQPQGKTRSLVVFWKFATAAVVLISLAIGFYAYRSAGTRSEIVWLEKYNGAGTRSMFTLPDGTRIWLNSESGIKYPKAFDSDTRDVKLTGEAFFHVASDAQKPFFIHLDQSTIRVIGTSFNVKAYKGDETIQTSVMTGKVAFIANHKDLKSKEDTVFLVKNNKVIYTLATGKMGREITNAQDDREWINGKLIWKSETLESIARQLERNFGKQVIIKDPRIGQYRYTGTFDESSLDEILQYLAMTKSFKYSIKENALVIY